MKWLLVVLSIGAAGCEIAPVDARSLDWNIDQKSQAAQPEAPALHAPSAGLPKVAQPTAPSPPAPSASARPSAATGVEVPATCGRAGSKPCPLQAMMRGAQGALLREDYASIERTFQRMAAMNPPGYDGWSEIALRGSTAARAHDKSAVGAACSGCHGMFRDKFRRSELRAKSLH